MPRHTIRSRLCSFCALVFVSLLLCGCAMPALAQPHATPDPAIGGMMAQVQTSTLRDRTNQLSGVKPALIGGSPYTFQTRETESGEPIEKATQFAYEFLAARGLAASYHNWRGC